MTTGSGGDRLGWDGLPARHRVDTDSDGSWSDETEHFNDTSVIDDWPAGYVGLYVGPQADDATEFDDVTMWMDTDSDGTIDEQQFADDFSSNEVTLTYDNNGNLTYDGVFTYVYDGWNRLRTVQRVTAGPTTTDVALYEYHADNRRSEKIVRHSGVEVVENDGGNTTVRFFYSGIDPSGSRWNILETRNGSNQATFQYVWGTQYVDELVLIDKNLEVTVDSDVDPDVTSAAETTDGDSPDNRFLVHQDRNWNVVALTDYDSDSTVEGAVVERYAYTPYGEVTILNGVGTTSREFGNVRSTSSVGNVFLRQGTAFDRERDSYVLRAPQGQPAAKATNPSHWLLDGILDVVNGPCAAVVEWALSNAGIVSRWSGAYSHCWSHCTITKYCGGSQVSKDTGITTERMQERICTLIRMFNLPAPVPGPCESAFQQSDFWDDEVGRQCGTTGMSCASCCECALGGKSKEDHPEGPDTQRPFGPQGDPPGERGDPERPMPPGWPPEPGQ